MDKINGFMGRKSVLYSILSLLFTFMVAQTIVACTSTGRFTTKSGEIDVAVTISKTCTGLTGMSAIVRGAEAGGLIDARGAEIHTAAKKVLDNFCDPARPPTDPGYAIASLAASLVDMGNLIATINK